MTNLSFRSLAFLGAAIAGAATPVLAADVPAPGVQYVTPAPVTSGPSYTVYSVLEGARFNYEFPGRNYKTRFYQSINGINVGLTPEFSVGGGFIYVKSDSDLFYLNGKSDSDGLLGFATATLNVQNWFTMGIAGGAGSYDTEQVRFIGPFRSTADIDSDAQFFSAYIQKDYAFGSWFVTPRARVVFNRTEADQYTESTGIVNPAESSTLGQLSLGGQVSYALPLGQGVVLYPTVEANFLYDFDLPLYQRDRTGVDLKAGVFASIGTLSFGAQYVTIVGRDELDEYHGGRLFASYRF